MIGATKRVQIKLCGVRTAKDALLCAECETRWAVCMDCDEAFVIAEASTSLRCEPCLVVHRRPARLAA